MKNLILLSFLFSLPLEAAKIDAFQSTEPELLASVIGKITAKGSAKPDFQMFRDGKKLPNGEIQVQRRFTTPDGKPAVTETIHYQNGKLKSFLFQDFQTPKKSEVKIEIKGDEVFFETKEKGKVVDTDNEDMEPETIPNDQIYSFLRRNFDKILKGETLKIRLLVPRRAETVGFKFFKEKEFVDNGQPAVLVKMKPSSFIIAAIVDPLYFTFNKKTKILYKYVGRATPKKLEDGKWKDLNGTSLFKGR